MIPQRVILAGLILVLLAPAAAAQLPTVTVTVTAKATGTWKNDGFLEAGVESARYLANATVVFSQTATCVDPVRVAFKTVPAPGAPISTAQADPAAKNLSVQPGGGTFYVETQSIFGVNASTPAGTNVSATLRTTVEKCDSPAGTSPQAVTNTTFYVLTLFHPVMQVRYTDRSDAGSFPFIVTNAGNGPMVVTAKVVPEAGSADQTANLPSSVKVAAATSASFTVSLPKAVPGKYSVDLTGTLDGPTAAQQPKATFTAHIQVPVPTTVTATKKSPTAAVAAPLALAIAVLLRRRA